MMNHPIINSFFFSTLTLITSTTQANVSTIALGQATYGGSGCPNGSTFARISPDGMTLSIGFGNFIVEVDGSSRTHSAQKSCAFAIPVQIPDGYSVSLESVNYNGFIYAPQASSVRLDIRHSFIGANPAFSTVFNSPYQDSYTRTQNFASLNQWSSCGGKATLRLNTRMTVRADQGFEAMGAPDSVDRLGVEYYLQYRPCR